MHNGESESNFYVRYRGRVTGPHNLSELSRMVRRGTLGRAHEISRDRAHWTAAGGISALFGTNQQAGADLPVELPSASIPDAGGMFYLDAGKPAGPVSAAMLETMAGDGRLLPDTIVWASGEPNSCAASAHPLLMHIAWPGVVAPGSMGAQSTPAGKSGCGVMLIIGALVLVAAGVWAAIWLSSSPNTDSPTSKPAVSSPASVEPTATPGGASQGLPTTNPAPTGSAPGVKN